jgi:hypothetical protein
MVLIVVCLALMVFEALVSIRNVSMQRLQTSTAVQLPG